MKRTAINESPKPNKTKYSHLPDADSYGRIYVIKLVLVDGTEVHKVGMVNTDDLSRVTDRMMEILRSFFTVYRYVPYAELRKAKKVRIPYIVEAYLHSLLADTKYTFDKKFSGSTECFEIDEESFLEYLDKFEYVEMLRGETKMKKDRYEAITEAMRLDRRLEASKATDELKF